MSEQKRPVQFKVTYPANYDVAALGGPEGLTQHYEATFGQHMEHLITKRGDLRIQERVNGNCQI